MSAAKSLMQYWNSRHGFPANERIAKLVNEYRTMLLQCRGGAKQISAVETALIENAAMAYGVCMLILEEGKVCGVFREESGLWSISPGFMKLQKFLNIQQRALSKLGISQNKKDSGIAQQVITDGAEQLQDVWKRYDNLEREKASRRSRNIAEQKARLGYSIGKPPFGYENVCYSNGVEVSRGMLHDCVRYRTKKDEARTVLAIFRMYDAGLGTVVIAKTMNGHPRYTGYLGMFFGGICPEVWSKGRLRVWSSTLVNYMLHNCLYAGQIVYNKKNPTKRLIHRAEYLHIVPEALWRDVQKRIQTVNESYPRDARGKLCGKPCLRRVC